MPSNKAWLEHKHGETNNQDALRDVYSPKIRGIVIVFDLREQEQQEHGSRRGKSGESTERAEPSLGRGAVILEMRLGGKHRGKLIGICDCKQDHRDKENSPDQTQIRLRPPQSRIAEACGR
jgi:hypothetical protein